MDYIVLDLEWNQSSNLSLENPRLPFEIIEVGAVKLDEQFNIIDEYSSYIKPRLYRKLHYKIRTMLNYDEDTLKTGRPFDVVCREFLAWCGSNYIFCTWGPLDLSNLQLNMDYYYMKKLEYPLKFYNIQDIFTMINDDEPNAAKLEKAVTCLGIEKDEPFHSAVNDARYTAYVLNRLSIPNFRDMYSTDYYNHPTNKDNEIIHYHKNYIEYVTREFDNKAAAINDKEVNILRCYKCNKKLTKKIRWFVNTSSTSFCGGKCWTHGYVCGKVRFKPTSNGAVFVIKTIESINKSEFENIRLRQEELRLKRKEKRKRRSLQNNKCNNPVN